MDLRDYTSAGQKQALPDSRAQALDILAMTNQELEDFLVNEYLENPMLESVEHKENEIMTSIEKFSDEGASASYAEQHPGNPEDEDLGGNEFSAKTGDQLRESLLGQINWKEHSRHDLKIMSYLIDCLDEKGFFTYDTRELAATSGYSQEDLDRCLAVLEDLEPVGIFSPDLAECLIRQLRAKEIQDPILRALLREHLTDLVNGQIGNISRHLGISTIQVKEYIHLIGSLNPRPVMDIQRSEASYVVPDILISRSGDRWSVEINDQWMGEYRFSQYYMNMMKESSDPELTAYFNERLERAKSVMGWVEQRGRVIVQVAESVLKRQEDHVRHQGPLTPMKLTDIAQELDIPYSTVALAVKGKFIQYKKTESLQSLFTSPV